MIGLFSSDDSPEAKAFMSAAAGIDRLPFATTSSKEVLKAYDATESSKVVVMKEYDEKKAVLDVTAATTEVCVGAEEQAKELPVVCWHRPALAS